MRVETMYKDKNKDCGKCKNWNRENESVFKECCKEKNSGYREKFYYADAHICHINKFEQL